MHLVQCKVQSKDRLREVSLSSYSVERNAQDTQLTTLASRVSRPRHLTLLRACTPFLNLKKKRDCSQSKVRVALFDLLNLCAQCKQFSSGLSYRVQARWHSGITRPTSRFFIIFSSNLDTKGISFRSILFVELVADIRIKALSFNPLPPWNPKINKNCFQD